ncbi:MAG: ABC transporter ATP-binding protein/permease [Neisseriaceae bacterium]|nr:ABC transporter ATP-binding protein/permease [Neisseriaceae bacterium]
MEKTVWATQLTESLMWLLKAYGITLSIGFLLAMVLIKTTRWGQQFWQISHEFLSIKRSIKPTLLILVILAFTLAAVRIDVLLTYWSQDMFNSLQSLDQAFFWASIWVFCTLATVHVARVLTGYLVQQYLVVSWREFLNEQLLTRWLHNQAYYRTHFAKDSIDNPDQRIQQDIDAFTNQSVGMSSGLIGAFVSIVEFTVVLYGLSKPFVLFGYSINHGMVWLAYVYVLVSTGLAFFIGQPLIQLKYASERLSANYRYALVRLREYTENIAIYQGEKVEKVIFNQGFSSMIRNLWQVIFRMLKLDGFNLIISQAAVIFPYMVQAPALFSKAINFGTFMATARAFGSLQSALSFFRQAYEDFASYKATLNRLTGFIDACLETEQLPKPTIKTYGSNLSIENLTLNKPDGEMLINQINATVSEGTSLLIRGPSGSGKTTLLRAIAGLWPYATGEITVPAGKILFLSQKPYLPLGSLRTGLFYPAPPDEQTDLAPILAHVQLDHLLKKMDTVDDWSRNLSVGEQQRLAFGRVLLSKPNVIFMDEATSAMDEKLEDVLYTLIREQLPKALIVSIGHRSTLNRHHDYALDIINGRSELTQLK